MLDNPPAIPNIRSGGRVSMLCCGQNWQPSNVIRVIEPILSSTCVVKVATDDGVGFLKGMGNPQGKKRLALELVGSELAALIGLTVPPFAIVDIAGMQIEMINGGSLDFGPAFISKLLQGSPSDGGGTFLKRLANPEDVPLLIAFDTWVRNIDRCPPADYLDPTPKWDNLFFTPYKRKFEMVVFDHTHCFVEGALDDGLTGNEFVEDDRIYGAFPEFMQMVSERALRRACGTIRRVDAGAIAEIVESIPIRWRPSTGTRQRWAQKIFERGSRMEEILFSGLVPQMQMPV